MDMETQPPLPYTTEVNSEREDKTATTSFSRFHQKRRSFGSSSLEKKKDTTDDDALPILGRLTAEYDEDMIETEANNNGGGSGVSLPPPIEESSDIDNVASSPFKMTAKTASQGEEHLTNVMTSTTTTSDEEDGDNESMMELPPDGAQNPGHEGREAASASTNFPSLTRNSASPENSLVESDEEEEKEWNLESDDDENTERGSTILISQETLKQGKEDIDPKQKYVESQNDDDNDKDEEEKAMEIEETAASPERSTTNDEPSDEDSFTKEPTVPTSNYKSTPKKIPDRQALITSTDQLFLQVSDKQKVTVKDILQALQIEYDCPKFDKQSRVIVRERLTALILGKVQPLEESDHEEEEDVSSSSEEEEVSESEASGAEADGDDSDYESRRKNMGHKKKTSKKKNSKKESTVSSSDRKSRVKRKSAAAIKAAAVRVQAEQLRKKRLEELRVRNEELQLIQNQEEQKRAAQIAAKLETDTEELRIARLEQRLDLLQKLDQKRFTVIQGSSSIEAEEDKEKLADEESDEDEESSNDEAELEFVGSKPIKPLVSFKPDALSLLSWADKGIRASATKKGKVKVSSNSKTNVYDAKADDLLSLLNQTKQIRSSPGQSMNSRAFLKKSLLSRQRRMGNQWLARELGYKNEREHMDDCLEMENQKRLMTLKKEQLRIEANERKALRERWIKAEDEPQDFDDDEDPDDEDYKDPGEDQNDQIQVQEEEEDEEMAMAREFGEVEFNEANLEESEAALSSTTEISDPLAKVEDTTTPRVETNVVEVSRDSLKNTLPVDEELMVSPPNRLVSADNSQEDGVCETVESTEAVPSIEVSVNAEAEVSVSANTHESETQPSIAIGGGSETLKFETQRVANSATTKNNETNEVAEQETATRPRNSAWRELLRREAEKVKKMKKRNGEMIDDEADEEEEDEIVGLEDFGFAMHKKKKTSDDDEENEGDDQLDEDDLENVVDDVSDGEGDEDAGAEARKALQLREEKERHKEVIRRIREGYDGRRGGIAGGGAGARGVHRFDQLVAPDNREDAKRLGLLNDDEMDSDDEKDPMADDDEEEDMAATLDQALKDRFLHRSSVEMEENFSEDEGEDDDITGTASGEKDEDLEEKEQERMAKRFTKRARMQRLIEAHGHEEEFSQMKLIEEDTTLKEELQKIKNGLVRKRSQSNSILSSDVSNVDSSSSKRQKVGMSAFVPSTNGSSLAIALQASRRKQNRTSFLRGNSIGSNETTASFQRSVGFKHVIFQSSSSRAASRGASQSQSSVFPGVVPSNFSKSTSLWSNVSKGFQKRH